VYTKTTKLILLFTIIFRSFSVFAQNDNVTYEQIIHSDSLLKDYYTHCISDIEESDSVVAKYFRKTKGALKKESLKNSIVFSRQSGYYENDFLLELSLKDDNNKQQIYYTLDGSSPTNLDTKYISPISVVECQDAKYGFKAFVIRAAVYDEDNRVSDIYSNTYIIGEELNTRYSFPVMSLITDPDNFFDNNIGIYVKGATYTGSQWSGNYHQSGIEWERDVHIQYFTKSGELAIDQDAGVRIHGGLQRTAKQKSLRLYARSEYGKSTFDYKLLPQKEKSSYKRFILRTSYGCWNNTVIKDGISAQLIKGLGVEYQEYRPVIVLVNGNYWGIQTIRDYMGTHHFSDKYSVDKDEVNICRETFMYEGKVNPFAKIDSIIENTDLASDNFYSQMNKRLDLQNFMNYNNSEIYLNNYDWPGSNRKFWQSNKYDSKIRCIFFDLDAAFNGKGGVSHDALHQATVPSSDWPNAPATVKVLESLLKNEKFKELFISNAAYLMNYYFDADTVIPKIEAMRDEYKPEIAEHCARWSFGSLSSWESKINTSLIKFAENRRTYVERHYISKFGLSGTSNLTLLVCKEGLTELEKSGKEMGQIYLNEQIIPNDNNVGRYFNDVHIELTAIASSGYKFVKWSDDNYENPRQIVLSKDSQYTAIFEKKSEDGITLVLNEALAKNKYGITDNYDELEDWFEIHNYGGNPVDISGLYITNDFQLPFMWKFPEADSLVFKSNEYKVFFADEDIHQGVLHTNFKLSKKGRTIFLVKNVNNIPVIIDSLKYPALDNDVSWGRNEIIAGEYEKFIIPTPGFYNNKSENNEGIYINEVLASNDNSITDEYGNNVDWIELYNSNNYDYYIGGMYLSDKGSDLTKFQIATDAIEQTTIPAKGYMVLYADDESEKGIKHVNFKLSNEGENLFLTKKNNGDFTIISNISFTNLEKDYSYGRIVDAADEFTVFSPENTTPGSANEYVSSKNGAVLTQEVTLVPNPAYSHVKIVSDIVINEIIIGSIIGEQLIHLFCEDKEVVVPITNLSSGTYFVKIKSNVEKDILSVLLVKNDI